MLLVSTFESLSGEKLLKQLLKVQSRRSFCFDFVARVSCTRAGERPFLDTKHETIEDACCLYISCGFAVHEITKTLKQTHIMFIAKCCFS